MSSSETLYLKGHVYPALLLGLLAPDCMKQ